MFLAQLYTNKGFVVLLPIKLMLSKRGSNLLHFATYLLHYLLRIGYISATVPATYQLHVGYEASGPATFWNQGMKLAHVRSRDDGRAQPRPARSTPGEPGRAADRQAFASLLTRLIDKSCAIRISGGQVSSCQ